MQNLFDFLEESYNPVSNSTQRSVMEKVYKECATAIKKGKMTGEEVLEMLGDVTETIKADFKLS